MMKRAAAGLPIVVSDRCGCARDLVRDGYSGYIVDASDLRALEHTLGTLLRDPSLCRRFGAEGRRIVARFSYEAAAEGVARAVELAVGPRRWSRACGLSASAV